MLTHLIFFFKQFSNRAPLGTIDHEFEILRTLDRQFERK